MTDRATELQMSHQSFHAVVHSQGTELFLHSSRQRVPPHFMPEFFVQWRPWSSHDMQLEHRQWSRGDRQSPGGSG